jgi:hypothetical protein
MEKKYIEMLKSALRHFAVTAVALYGAGITDIKALVFATLAAVVGPAIRGIDKNDPAFGLVADTVENAIIAAASKSKKKTK